MMHRNIFTIAQLLILISPTFCSVYSNIDSIRSLTKLHDFEGKLNGDEGGTHDEGYAFCISTKQTEAQSTNTRSIFGPFFIFALEDDSLNLPCLPCSYESSPNFSWFKLSFEGETTTVDSDSSQLNVDRNGNLIITSLSTDDFGTYYCKANEHVGYIWSIEPNLYEHLQIVPSRVWEKLPDSTNLSFPNAMISTRFESWSFCNKCNYVGKQHRFGYCYVTPVDVSNESGPDFLYNVFYAYPNGLSCKLFLLLHPELNLDVKRALITRGPYLMLGFCNVSCQELDFIPQTRFKQLDSKLQEIYKKDLRQLIAEAELLQNFDRRLLEERREIVFSFIPTRAPTSFEWFLLLSLVSLQIYILIHVCKNRSKAK